MVSSAGTIVCSDGVTGGADAIADGAAIDRRHGRGRRGRRRGLRRSAIAAGTATCGTDAAAGASAPRRVGATASPARELTACAGTMPSTTGSSAPASDRSASVRTTMTDAPASTTRSAHVETPAPEIDVSPTRTVIAPRTTTRADPAVGVAHDERERRRRGEACGGEPVEHVRRRVVRRRAAATGPRGRTPPSTERAARRAPRTAASHPFAGSGRYVAMLASLRCAASCPRRRATATRGDRAWSRRRRRSRARTPRRSP